ncbi:40S ribosomal protein [Cichlidogyrus casuarinus]|uniref:40S ribosomal protein S8 n=1 Tax=Cichlidogyrus casuarinus TaxID=1844966 RepID=A0ABD2QF32_9PLAT
MGIAQDRIHKRSKSGARRERVRKKRKYELGRPAAMTKLGPKRVHFVRVRGGSMKHRAMRLEQGSFSWPTQAISRKTRIIDVLYNASSNELVRTKTLVKNCIVQIDSAPFRQWYEAHYLTELGRRVVKSGKTEKSVKDHAENEVINRQRSKKCMKKYTRRQKLPIASVEDPLKDQFASGRILACISSRPGQIGRADGYILEGKELEFYMKKIKSKKAK